MLNDKVPNAMANAFETAPGDLAERMMMALKQRRKWRRHSRQTISSNDNGQSTIVWQVLADRTVDLRVEDHPEPLKELRRLVIVARAYGHMNTGDAAIEKNDVETALKEYGEAMKLAGENVEIAFWERVNIGPERQSRSSVADFQESLLTRQKLG